MDTSLLVVNALQALVAQIEDLPSQALWQRCGSGNATRTKPRAPETEL